MTKIFKLSKAELIAKKVLYESGLDDPTEMPLEEIIFGRGAFYSEKPLVGKDGEIVTIDNKSMITVNANISFSGRKRFVAAHELGHFEMHRKLSPIITDTEQDLLSWFLGGKHEVEANEFASEFLMPSDKFYQECRNKVFSTSVIDHLSDRFQVSKTAAILKFVKAGIIPFV